MESVKKNYAVLPDVLGISLCASGALLAFALLSFTAADNSVYAHGDYQIQNWVGPGGALIANFFYTCFGFLALGIPVLLITLGVFSFYRRLDFWPATRMAGLLVLMLGMSILLEEAGRTMVWVPFPWGGLFGYGLHSLLLWAFSGVGVWLVSLTLLSLGGVLWFGGIRWPVRKILEPTLEVPEFLPASLSLAPSPSTVEGPTIAKRVIEKTPDIAGELRHVSDFELPPLKLLDYDAPPSVKIDERMMRAQAERLEKTFAQFGIEGQVREIRPGPVVTCFEFVPAPGIKLSRIATLADDIAMAMSAIHVRIVAPIPGKGAVGIEIPNETRETVYLKEIVSHQAYRDQTHPLCMALGKTI